MAQPPTPGGGTPGTPNTAVPRTTMSQGPPFSSTAPQGSTLPNSRLQTPSTLRSISVPAPQLTPITVQAVQLTAQARRLQPELVTVMKKVQEIERDFQAREEQLAREEHEMEVQHQQREQELEERRQQQQHEIDKKRHQLAVDTAAFDNRMNWEKERLQTEREQLERTKREGERIIDRQEPVTVEVGGDKFRTELSTLTKSRNSIFPNLVRALERREEARDTPNRPKRDPYIFIDRDGRHFKFILNYLRQGPEVMKGTALRNADQHVLREIIQEVRYYQLAELEQLLVLKMASLERPITFNMLITGRLFQMQTNPQVQYKYSTVQDVEIQGKNLTEIKFDQVVFAHSVSFKGCLLVRAVFRGCCFQNTIKFISTDLADARFENCEGVQLSLRFCYENTNQRGMTFDPALPVDDDS